MQDSTKVVWKRQMSWLRRQFVQGPALPFGDVLTAESLAASLDTAGVQTAEPIYDPLTVLRMFLSQALNPDASCRAVVARLLAERTAQGLPPCSPQTGGYCQARQRLPEVLFADAMRQAGTRLDQRVSPDWRWHGRDVKIADGTTLSMPDTPANQDAYPQPASQKPGLGFPLLRLLAIFSLASGAVLDAAVARYQGKYQSELGLLRHIWHRALQAGDILLGDRYFCSWFEIAILQRLGVDVVTRLHQARRADFRRGQRLGFEDHIVAWPKPARPDWLTPEEYDALPDELVVRELQVHVSNPGCRVRDLIVVTTLTDPESYPRDDVAELFRQRWHAELDLRSLKQTLQMDVLRGHSPDIVHKEIWVHLLAYNLLRTVMAQAAWLHALPPRQLSFKGALQTLLSFQPLLATAAPERVHQVRRSLWSALASHRVGQRPGRHEPRARKRRPKPYPLLMQPRAEARNALRYKQKQRIK